jgi:serine/threonine protein kinase
MTIQIRCPNPACGRTISLRDDQAGKTLRCTACQQVFTAPVPAARVVARPKPPAQEEPETLKLEPDQLAPAQKAASSDPWVGRTMLHYQIQSVIGQGGMGKVYKARNVSLSKTCAIKFLPKEFASQDPTLVQRFLREARSAAAVEHPNVLPVHSVGKVQEDYYIEMQYVDGSTLHGILKQRGRMEASEAARIVRDVALGLAAAHEKGIIHRDVKPGNVMVSAKGHVFIMDFGLAKMAEGTSALTRKGTVLGTPLYMSPEQAMARPLDARTDIYSLGAMFYHLLTGSPPYVSKTALEIVGQHIKGPIPDPASLVPDTPPLFSAMIQKMMAKNVDDRYASCAEIAQELDAFLSGAGTGPVPAAAGPAGTRVLRALPVKGRQRRLWPVIIGVAVAAAAIGAVILYLLLTGGLGK